MRSTAHILVVLALLITTTNAGAVELARVQRLERDEVGSSYFTLTAKQDLAIRGTVFDDRLSSSPQAWLLNSATRDVVWESDQADVVSEDDPLLKIEDTIALPAGQYELYLSTHASPYRKRGLRDWISGLLRGDLGWDGLDRAARDMRLVITGDAGEPGGTSSADRVRGLLEKGSFLCLTGLGDNVSAKHGFKVLTPTTVDIYAVGEATRDGAFDSSWIVRISDHETMWRFDYWDTERGGGARKNRSAQSALKLEPGLYALYVSTDSSHSWPRFNAEPPRDPMAWGITLRTADTDSIEPISDTELQRQSHRNVIAELVGLGDDEHRQIGFTLTRPLDVRVIAIGEGREGGMNDTSWLVDASTLDTVWRMNYLDTEHAGGATKNRIADQTLQLKPGSYVLHATTDGSHSAHRWNAAPPFERDRWGVTLLAISPTFSEKDVTAYDPAADPAILARIADVGDNADEIARFTLDRDQEVQILAVGEGDDDEMYDYAWITSSDSGRPIWRMTYGITEHAGGAEKNRRFKGTVKLKAGSYELHYTSDSSHSADDWNAALPDDPGAWGATVRALPQGTK